MTKTEWIRKRRRILDGSPAEWNDRDGRHEIRIFDGRYGKEYALHTNGRTVMVSCDINRIGELLID